MREIIRKFVSRKFIAAAASFLFGVVISLLSLDANVAVACMGAGISGASTLAYIITEGRIDLAAIKKTAESFKDAAETITNSKDSGSLLNKFDSIPEKNE